MGKGTKLYGFVCKTGSRTVKSITQNAPKLTILRAKIQNFSEEGHSQWGGGHHLRTPHPLRRLNRRAYGARPWRLRRLVLPNWLVQF